MALSGQTIVPAAGTGVALGTQAVNGPLLVKALDTNAGIIAVGENGSRTVTLASGVRLAAGGEVRFEWVGSLRDVFINAVQNNDGAAWLILRG
jgi:hypothetical protein